MSTSKHLYMVGAAIGLDSIVGLEFDINRPYTGCRICGTVFQSKLDRTFRTPAFEFQASEKRRIWSLKHARTHSRREHELLMLSGAWCTPEAAHKFAALGIIPVTDMVLNEGVRDALETAPSIPVEDCVS